jgi:hypothetical protein
VDLNITAGMLQKKKLMIATPMYGGQCSGTFTKSANDLAMACVRHGIEIRFYYLFNESLITRARNYCADEFIRSDSTHLMFIDSDIGFDYKDVLTLLHLCDEGTGYDVITGPYPKKTIAWEKIKKAVEAGFADKTPFALEQFMGDFVFNPVAGTTEFRLDEPVEVQEAGTGFMMIHKSVFSKYAEAFPELSYKPDHIRTASFDGSREIHAYFDCIIDPETRRYLSEDYMFCYNVRKIDMKVWMCPWMKLKHIGSYTFGGSLAALAAIAASPTASVESNSKNYLTTPSKDDKINRQQRRAAKKGKGK